MSSPSNLWNREPALVVYFVQSAVMLAVAFGLDLEPEQIAAIYLFVAGALSLVVRRKVSPVVAIPTEPDGDLEG